MTVEIIWDIAIKAIEEDHHYEGRIDGTEMRSVITFEIDVPIQELEEELTSLPEWFRVIAVDTVLFERYALRVMSDGKLITGVPQEDLDMVFLQPILMAISLLIDLKTRENVDEGTFRVPRIADGEMSQFSSPDDFLEYVLSLNRQTALG